MDHRIKSFSFLWWSSSIWIPCEWRICRMETLLLSAIWFSYFKYGTCLFNGTSRQQAYSCMWPSTRPILGAKGWTNSRGLVHWGQHHMKPLALPFVGLWMEYGWKVSLASLVNRPWLVFSLVPTAIELRYLYSWNKTDLHKDLRFWNKIGHFHI